MHEWYQTHDIVSLSSFQFKAELKLSWSLAFQNQLFEIYQMAVRPSKMAKHVPISPWHKSTWNFLPRYRTELSLGPLRSPGRPASVGIWNVKKCPQLFANVQNGDLSWPTAKPRPTCIHCQSKHKKVSATFCPSTKRSSFLAHFEAEIKPNPFGPLFGQCNSKMQEKSQGRKMSLGMFAVCTEHF